MTDEFAEFPAWSLKKFDQLAIASQKRRTGDFHLWMWWSFFLAGNIQKPISVVSEKRVWNPVLYFESPFLYIGSRIYWSRLPYSGLSGEWLGEILKYFGTVRRTYNDEFQIFCLQWSCEFKFSGLHSAERACRLELVGMLVLDCSEVRMHPQINKHGTFGFLAGQRKTFVTVWLQSVTMRCLEEVKQ